MAQVNGNLPLCFGVIVKVTFVPPVRSWIFPSSHGIRIVLIHPGIVSLTSMTIVYVSPFLTVISLGLSPEESV